MCLEHFIGKLGLGPKPQNPPPGRRPQWSVSNLVDVSGDAGLTSLRAGYLFSCMARVTLEFPARLFGHLDRVQNWTPF